MRLSLLTLACSLVPVAALADAPAGAKMTPGVYPEKAAVWKRFVVRDITLGTEIEKIAGFTCDVRPTEAPQAGFGRAPNHTCVKFFDDRCQGRPTIVKHIGYASDIPKGQGCTFDISTNATYLDGKHTTAPLSYVAAKGTDTDVPRAWSIRYTFAKDVLSPESNTGKALIAKYGEPGFKNPPMQMSWKADSVNLSAECGGIQGPQGDFCLLEVEDGGLLDSERSVQRAFDEKKALKNGPPAPKL